MIRAIVACHNRRALTVRAVLGLALAARQADVAIEFTIYDDGSTDGTAGALLDLGLHLTIVPGAGSDFWALSMARAEAHALIGANPGDSVFWFNDDAEFDANALSVLLRCARKHPGAVVVGALRDPTTQVVTYGGFRREGWHPRSFRLVPIADRSTPVDTFNGNAVLVPIAAARRVGGIDGGFSHSLADIDYGLRCRWLSIPVLVAPGSIGTCARNPSGPAGGVRRKWRQFIGVTGGGHFASTRRFVRRHEPAKWPAAIVVTYLLWWSRHFAALVQST
ncbi:glycosyltransferase family 2 protein [Cryobacterium sp. Y82]|uniref:glycosyltransferase family 2 protein n=1 Tax=Cryobacterium sp. Y82 TaxID=2045017 RepID=UPI001304B258|nr:glycosyltransferase [Cryobacterium sp. Y82]